MEDMVFKNRKKTVQGFTLSEVLITLGIIGIVAGMTIPTLMNNIQNVQFKVMFKKEFSNFSNAVNQIKNDNGGDLVSAFPTNGSTILIDNFDPYLSYIKKCTNDAQKSCWHQNNTWFDQQGTPMPGGSGFWSSAGKWGYILKDGAYIFFNYPGNNGLPIAMIYIDVNGENKPNKLGKDIFGLYIGIDAVKPYGLANSPVISPLDGEPYDKCGTTWGIGTGCSGAVILNYNY